MARRYPQAKGACRICGKKDKLDPHHIISQHRLKQIGRESDITNPGNIVHLCRACHKETTSYLIREGKYDSKPKPKPKREKVKRKVKPKKQPRCEAMTEMMERCKNRAAKGHHVCGYHRRRRRPGFRRKW